MDETQAAAYLGGLLGKQLRITTTDTRMFVGRFKCTDRVGKVEADIHEREADLHQDRNIILSGTYEYRQPPLALAIVGSETTADRSKWRVDMTSRFLGLVVVPGEHITKIEVQELLVESE